MPAPVHNIGGAPVVALRDVRKVHGQGDGAVVALDGISVGLLPGSFTAIMGPSGSGKSTFLNVAAGLDRPTSAAVALAGTDLAGLSERRLTILRRETGALVALIASSALVMAGAMPLEAALRNHPPVERYAGTAAVVTGDQDVGPDNDVRWRAGRPR